MSLFEFKLPDIGEGVMEGEIVNWLVSPGQDVREDEPMVEVMTDKATVTIGAPKTGVIQDLLAKVGDVVEVGSVIVTLSMNGAVSRAATTKHSAPPPPEPAHAAASAPDAASAAARKDDGPAATAVGDIRESLPGTGLYTKPEAAPPKAPAATPPAATSKAAAAPRAPATSAHFNERPLAAPATRKVARELGVDLRYVMGTGPGGRVTQDDVRSYMTASAAPTTTGGPAPVEASGGIGPSRARISVPATEGEVRTPFVGVRRKIAERMQASKNTAAHFTFVEECEVDRLSELRGRLRDPAEAAGVKLTFLPFIVKAVVAALKRHPVLNSALDETTNELVTRNVYNIGIAASTDAGLMVPVVKDADKLSLLEIAAEIERLGAAAKAGRIAATDLVGSTFTITSLGKEGGLFATPILNFPEVGILGVHRIKERPVVRDGAIVIGQVMLLSLSFDHRIVDGHVGAAFAYDIIRYLENPERLFLEMA